MNVLMVTNLRSGFGDSGLYEYVRELGSHRVEVTMRFLDDGADLHHLLRDASAYARVVAAGGDGTVSAVAYALRDTGIPVLAYPAGTANLLARNLRLPVDPIDLAVATIAGRTVTIDLGELTLPARDGRTGRRRGFSIAAGAGFDAKLIEAAQPLKASLGEGAYIIGAMQNLVPTVSKFTLTLDGKVVETEGIAVMLMNLARIQFDLAVTHGSDAQDGLLEVVIVKPASPAALLPTVWAALLDRLTEHPKRPGLEIHTASAVEVVAQPRLPIEYDGEMLDATTPFSARVLPRAATMIVSEESPLPRDEIRLDRDGEVG
ncbi:MAG: diacylglycerol kinase [Actinobacteria bacterium]|nr:diacylglycerol kinase [Actinomycetota bacterium]